MERHIKELNIDSYRGIKNLHLEDLNKINILTGDNNSGKTSVLEVLSSFSNPLSIDGWKNALRTHHRTKNDLDLFESIKLLFDIEGDTIKYSFNGDSSKIKIEKKEEEIELTVKEIEKISNLPLVEKTNKNSDELELVQKMELSFFKNDKLENKEDIYDFSRQRYSKNGKELYKTVYVSPFQHIEETMYLNNILDDPELYEEMIKILQEFDKEILSINASRVNNSIVYKILSKKKSLPLNVYGEGMKKAVLLLSAVINAKNGMLLIDEFETAIHTSIMNKVFSWILKTSVKLNVQLFLTSHSKEAIEKILTCSPELQDKINLYTLYTKEYKTVARKLNAKKAIEVSREFGLELR